MSGPPPPVDRGTVTRIGGEAAELTREGRVYLLGILAADLLADRAPNREAAFFVGGAIQSWLTEGGSLERDFLRVVAPKSHRTPAVVWRELNPHPDEPTDPAGRGNIGAVPNDGGKHDEP